MIWRKIFHWGPIFAIIVMKLVFWSTIDCIFVWWPPFHSWSGFLNSIVFLLISLSTIYNFLYSICVGPGYLPLNWKPENENDTQFLQFCTVCKGFKAPRSHHCRRCNRCVMKQDHHCVFINNCLGHQNHTSFILFLISAILGSLQACVIITCKLYRGSHTVSYYHVHSSLVEAPFLHLRLDPVFICMESLGIASGVVLAVGFLFFVQLKVLLRNETIIEDLIREKAVLRRKGTDEPVFLHPYDLGWRENFVQVINWSFRPKGDGITWKVRENCHLYALTIEQLEQKKFKRENSVEYAVRKPYSGRCFPITHGFQVCFNPPCAFETRLPLQIGDKVKVSGEKKYWLYGKVIERRQIQVNPTERRALRGWFPRACCSALSIKEGQKIESKKN